MPQGSPEQHQSEGHAEQRVDGEEAGKADHQGRDDDEEAADEGLQDVPVGPPHVQVALLAFVE